jgi:hypothetical protein
LPAIEAAVVCERGGSRLATVNAAKAHAAGVRAASAKPSHASQPAQKGDRTLSFQLSAGRHRITDAPAGV